MVGAPKKKISVTIASELVQQIDHEVATKRLASRSAAIEQALKRWAREQRELEIDRYYDSLTATERKEDLDWAELGYEALVRTHATVPGRSVRARGSVKRAQPRGGPRR